nr:hypothetical protein BHI3_35350 [Bacteriovorax sp. HI3]
MITEKMVKTHLTKALSEGGLIAENLKVTELEKKTTSFRSLDELDYNHPENKAFYSAAYALMDAHAQELVTEHKRRIGGFNLYPINFHAERIQIRPRVFSGQYRMGFCNFELASSMLSAGILEKLNELYRFIRSEVESEVEYNTEDSTMVLHRTGWEPPHFHVQDKDHADDIYSVSYAVRIAGTKESTSVFDFFSDSFKVFDSPENSITKIYFKSKFIHQVFKTSIKDDDLYFFFVWDGCKFKKPINLDDNIYVQRLYCPKV